MKFNIRQKRRMPTIPTVIDGLLCARSSKRFSPGINAIIPALQTRRAWLREVPDLPRVAQRVGAGVVIQTQVGLTAGHVLITVPASSVLSRAFPSPIGSNY